MDGQGSSLSTQINELKDQHAERTFERRKSDQQNSELGEAMYILGRIKQTGHLAQAIAANLSAQEVRALEQFQKEKMFKALKYDSFDEFLDESPYAPVTKRQYYDRLALVRKHGDEIYDLLTSMGISIRAAKLLGKGELAIKNDTLMVGDREVEIGKDSHLVKQVLNELFDEKRELTEKKEKLLKTIDNQNEKLRRGQEEFDELRRNFDALSQDTPFARSLMKAVGALSELANDIKSLSETERQSRGVDDVRTLTSLLFRVRDAYGVSTPIAEPIEVTPGSSLEDRALAEISRDDDFGDEEEGS